MRRLQIAPSLTNRESSSVEAYFTEIGRLPLITAEEEAALARKIRQGDAAALEGLTSANLRFVVSVAKRYQHQGLSLADLIAEGNLGLIEAARRFDETRGFKFISFAVWWVRRAMLAAIADHTRTIRLPRYLVNQLTKINKAAAELEEQLGRRPGTEELAERLAVPPEQVQEAFYYSDRALSYDAPIGSIPDFTLLDITAGGEPNGEDQLLLAEQAQSLERALETLSPKERRVIDLLYGLNGSGLYSPTEIAPGLSVSAERVRQIRKEAIGKLRKTAFLLTALPKNEL